MIEIVFVCLLKQITGQCFNQTRHKKTEVLSQLLCMKGDYVNASILDFSFSYFLVEEQVITKH